MGARSGVLGRSRLHGSFGEARGMWPHGHERRRGVLADHPVDDDPRCRACDGVCCRSFPTVALESDEYRRLEELGARRLEWTFTGRWLVIENGCEFQQPDGRCGIYAERPRICRRFICAG